MKLKVCLAVALTALFALTSFADDPKKQQDDQAAMDAMMKAATPGDAHRKLDKMAGTFTTKVSTWMAPNTEPMTTEGTSENRWILGGRYLEQRFSGNFMGMPFEGIGYTGYDNVKKQYWGTWMDNMSTGMMMSTGKASGDNAYTFTGSMADPMTGKDTTVEERIVVHSDDHHTMEMWGPGPDGKSYKMMAIDYTRKK